ncbi:hypothetical protein [Phenylobacterium sp.]|uniref:hypothetical protein n=1 Tax=Phenylobacterium sp. TaxID=1871053 RepID=UPI002E314095|nr:hypothetical protein [Phenylobacterium sp.]HEX2562224.1 hypothetical protein [Phenylobacterium sp.]
MLAALALACSDAAAQTRAGASAEAAITLVEPAGLRTAAAFAVSRRGSSGQVQGVIAVSEPPGAAYQLVTPERIAAGALVLETSDLLRSGEGEARVPIGASFHLPAAPAGEHLGLLPVLAVFD